MFISGEKKEETKKGCIKMVQRKKLNVKGNVGKNDVKGINFW